MSRLLLNKEFAMDTFFGSTQALHGYTCAQLFIGKTSRYMKVYPLCQESHGVEALKDFICDVGIPWCLRSDNAKMETQGKWAKVCCQYKIKQCNTEPHHSHQNPVE